MFITGCKTRWDSDFLMMDRFVKMEPVVKEILKNHEWRHKLEGTGNKKRRVFDDEELSRELDLELSVADWNAMSKMVEILKPFKDATEEFSKSTANISKVIPVISTLMEAVTEERFDAKVVKDLKRKIREQLTTRLGDEVEKEDLYTLSTLLDPTVKDQLFRDQELLQIAKTELERKVLLEAEKNDNNNDPNEGNESAEEVENPVNASSLMEKMRANLKKRRKTTTNSLSVKKKVELAVREYLEEDLEPTRLLKYWKDKLEKAQQEDDKVKIAFCMVAKKYLTPPPSTVDVERLFSTCGNILTAKRNRLLPANLEKLVFLRTNYLATGIVYE